MTTEMADHTPLINLTKGLEIIIRTFDGISYKGQYELQTTLGNICMFDNAANDYMVISMGTIRTITILFREED